MPASSRRNFDEVIHFWFTELKPEQQWAVDSAIDATIIQRFASLHEAANRGELHEWRTEPGGRLAEIILLDQFSRNMFRNSARAFASDSMALALAQEAVAGSHDSALPQEQRLFLWVFVETSG